MRKALLPLVASLALCGAATVALIATNASAAQTARKPVMVTLAGASSLEADAAAPPAEGGPGMMRDGMGRGSFCKEMVARKAGELAYLEAKLALTPAQAPLYGHWKQVMLDIAQKHQSDCGTMLARKPGERRSLMDGMTREENRLKTRLADLEAERPALSALYDALNPEQKAELGRAARHQMQGRMHMMMGMMGRRPGMMGHPMGRGPDGPGAPPPQ